MAGTAGACPTGGDLTPISTMTSIAPTTSVTISTRTRDLAIDYGSSRGEEAHHCKMRNGDEVDLGLPFLLITGNLKEVVPTVGPLGLGKDGDLQMTDTHGILRMHASEEGEMRASGEEDPRDMRAGDPGAEMAFLALKILGQMMLLTLQMKIPEEGTMVLGGEVEVLQEELGRVCFLLQMNSHVLKEGGNQNPGMETENQVLVQTTLLMMGILQPTENVPPPSRAWTWPHCHHGNVPGTTDPEPLTTETWMLQGDLQRRGAKDEEIQDLHRERQNLGGPVL